ncbi:hypothetical protein CYY_001253 [Polysphondylium violaceum]|uniref:Uncharacterized protein n=1 Tax=Polysphondylium violaceum TaxID=133409 RepID=A0A8J4Q244_9MYCE|nr:hypothetical protein CYY_001253 [Polysphondylium violaceum]
MQRDFQNWYDQSLKWAKTSNDGEYNNIVIKEIYDIIDPFSKFLSKLYSEIESLDIVEIEKKYLYLPRFLKNVNSNPFFTLLCNKRGIKSTEANIQLLDDSTLDVKDTNDHYFQSISFSLKNIQLLLYDKVKHSNIYNNGNKTSIESGLKEFINYILYNNISLEEQQQQKIQDNEDLSKSFQLLNVLGFSLDDFNKEVESILLESNHEQINTLASSLLQPPQEFSLEKYTNQLSIINNDSTLTKTLLSSNLESFQEQQQQQQFVYNTFDKQFIENINQSNLKYGLNNQQIYLKCLLDIVITGFKKEEAKQNYSIPQVLLSNQIPHQCIRNPFMYQYTIKLLVKLYSQVKRPFSLFEQYILKFISSFTKTCLQLYDKLYNHANTNTNTTTTINNHFIVRSYPKRFESYILELMECSKLEVQLEPSMILSRLNEKKKLLLSAYQGSESKVFEKILMDLWTLHIQFRDIYIISVQQLKKIKSKTTNNNNNNDDHNELDLVLEYIIHYHFPLQNKLISSEIDESKLKSTLETYSPDKDSINNILLKLIK